MSYSHDASVVILPEGPFYIEHHVDGLDRRVFRYTGHEDELEFAYYRDWQGMGGRARWYGYAPRSLPQSIQAIL